MAARLLMLRGARHASWSLAGRRALASSSGRAGERPGGPPTPIDAVVRGADDLDRAELLSGASHSLDRALVEQMLHSDEQEVAAREWLHEAQSGQLDPDFERYLDWEDAQVARVRALRAGLVEGTGEAAAAGEGAAAGAVVEGEEPSAEADAGLDDADGEAEGGAQAASDGRLLPRIPVEYMNDFPGELRRDELNTPAERALLEQTAAVHAAEGMPFELSEISHRQKEALYALHTADPVTYSAERMATMLAFPADHVRAILFLQREQAQREAAMAEAASDSEEGAAAKAKARQLFSELSELATEYDRQFDPFLDRAQVQAHLALGARALRNPSLSSPAVAERAYARQRLDASSAAQLESADRSAALERFVEFEERAYHFGRTSPQRLEALAAKAAAQALPLAAPRRAGPRHPLSEPEELVAGSQPAYRTAVLAQLKKLDGYTQAERNAYEAVTRAHSAKEKGGAKAAESPEAEEAEAIARMAEAREGGGADGPFEHPGLSEAELVELLAADAARYRLPELLSPAIAQLLFDAQYFAPEFDLPHGELEQRRRAEARASAEGAQAAGVGAGAALSTGFVTLPASVAPFTTLVPTGRSTPKFRYVADLGPDAHYLSKREQETIARRAARAQESVQVGFDPAAAERRVARNRQRRFQQKRPGEFVVIDTTAQEGALRNSRAKPSGRVIVYQQGTSRAGTEEEHDEARRYLGHGATRPHRLRFG